MRYLWYASPDGCLLVEADTPNLDRLTQGRRLAGEFDAPDHGAAVLELRRRMEELQAKMEGKGDGDRVVL